MISIVKNIRKVFSSNSGGGGGSPLPYTPEDVANKSTSVVTDQASNVKYPSVKAVYDWATSLFQTSLGFTPENVSNKSTNTSLGTSDTLYPTQNAVKVYTDNILGNANALVYKGVLDCSTNPNYPAADAGFMYIANVAGKIGGASGIDVEVGDMIICNTDGTVSGNQATVGIYWNIIQKNIVGAVTGPASSVNNNVAFFDGTTGKIIKDSGLTLSGTNTGDQTFITPRLQTVTSAAIVTPTSNNDVVVITAQAVGLTLANPTGSPVQGQSMLIKIKDNGVSRTIAFDTMYRAVNTTLPVSTTISKVLYIALVYNSDDAKWDVVGVALEGASPSTVTMDVLQIQVFS